MQFFGGTEISPSPPAPTASGNNAHMLYIFNRNGVCLLYREWNRPLKTLSPQQDHKLMFGLLFSLKSLTAKMDPTSAEKGNLGVPQLPGQGCSFHSFRTNTYKLSFMESPSGIKPELLGYIMMSFYDLYCEIGFCPKHDFPSASRDYISNLRVSTVIRQYRGKILKYNSALNPYSSVKLILVTHPKTGDLRDSLKYIYNLYVEYVVKNPLYSPGTPISCELFNKTVDQYVRGLG